MHLHPQLLGYNNVVGPVLLLDALKSERTTDNA